MDRANDIERASSSEEKTHSQVDYNHVRDDTRKKLPLKTRIASVVWDSLDKTPEERKFIAKIDWWILSYCCIGTYTHSRPRYHDHC
jgi:MFS transporter, ACS family, pantothenate transporter